MAVGQPVDLLSQQNLECHHKTKCLVFSVILASRHAEIKHCCQHPKHWKGEGWHPESPVQFRLLTDRQALAPGLCDAIPKCKNVLQQYFGVRSKEGLLFFFTVKWQSPGFQQRGHFLLPHLLYSYFYFILLLRENPTKAKSHQKQHPLHATCWQFFVFG